MATPLDHHARAFNALRERLAADFGLDADDEAVVDTAEGETDLVGLLVRMIRAARERAAQADVCAEQIKALSERKKRHTDAADRLRALVAETMLDTGLKKIAPGDFTASARLLAPKIETDVSALPTFYTRQVVSVVADMDAIKGELARCEDQREPFMVPGVSIGNGKPSLTVRI